MTDRDQLLEQLEQANPIPDPARIYTDAPAARRFSAAVEAKRAEPASPTRPWALPLLGQRTTGWLAAGLAFAAVFAVLGTGILLTQQDVDVPVTATTTGPEPVPTTTEPPTPTTVPPSTTTEPPPTTTEPSTTTTTTTTTPSTTVPPAQRFTLGDPVAPPEGVAAGFGPFIAEGGALCDEHTALPAPVILESRLGYDGGTGPVFCLVGYDLTRPVEVSVTFDGVPVRSYVLDPDVDVWFESFLFVWRSLPTDPLGRYEMVALQDGEGDNHTFRVIEPLDPGLTIEARSIAVGETTRIVLFRFEPNSDVPVHFYWIDYDDPAAEENGFTYVATATVHTDDAGWAVLDVETGPSARPGTYVVDTEKGFIGGILPPYVVHVFDITR